MTETKKKSGPDTIIQSVIEEMVKRTGRKPEDIAAELMSGENTVQPPIGSDLPIETHKRDQEANIGLSLNNILRKKKSRNSK